MDDSAPRGLTRPALTVTFLTVVAQLVALASQVVLAHEFGARANMDAFLAANTLPQYIVTVLLGALAAVFVPVYIEYDGTGRHEEAWRIAGAVVTAAGSLLVLLALGGILFAGPLVRMSTPGLSDESLALATLVARITWPSIAATGLVGLLTGIYHAKASFSWPAVVPAIGAAVNLVLILALAPRWGVSGVAAAAVIAIVAQAVLLLRGLPGRERLRLSFEWRHPGVVQVARLLWPLVVSGLLIRYTPIVDRFLASNQPEGAITHLGYAFKLATLASLFLSTGIATVVFPRMALNRAAQDLGAMRDTISLGLRIMWLAVAPVVAVGIVLARPLITVVLERGAFLPDDTVAVSGLLAVYLLSVAGAGFGAITGRAFYALQNTRTVAVVGVIEAIAYAGYTTLLARRFGPMGIAFGFVLYYSLSIAWQLPVLRSRLGGMGGTRLLLSFARTGAAAVAAAFVAAGLARLGGAPVVQLVTGSVAGSAVYAGALWLFGGDDVKWAAATAMAVLRRRT